MSYIIKSISNDAREAVQGKVFTLLVADLDLIPDILYGPPNTTKNNC